MHIYSYGTKKSHCCFCCYCRLAVPSIMSSIRYGEKGSRNKRQQRVPGAGSVRLSVRQSVCVCVWGLHTRPTSTRSLFALDRQTIHSPGQSSLWLLLLWCFVWTVCYICRAQTIKIVWVTRLISLFPPLPLSLNTLLLSPFFSSSSLS